MSRSRRSWLLPLSVLIALLLGLLPLPQMLQPFRPYWLAIVLAYWVLEEHERIGLGFAFFLGVFADLAFGSVLGEQALRLCVMTFILQRFRPQLRFFPLPQQSLVIGGLLLNDLVIAAVAQFILGEPTRSAIWWWTPLIGAVLWPPLFVVMDALRLGRKI
jgi:rod shape-determining protein MreD